MKLSREFIVGILFVLALGLFYWGYNFLKGDPVFSQEKLFYGVYERVDGLSKNNPISINGFEIGKVKDMYFTEDLSGKIVVVMNIKTDFPIPKNSSARIFSSDLLGSKGIQIRLGDSPELAKPGDTLSTGIEGSLAEEVNKQVQPLKAKAENLMGTIDSVVTVISMIFNENSRMQVTSSLQSIQQSFENLKNITYQVDTTVATQTTRLADILIHIENVAHNLDANQDEFNHIINNMSVISDSLTQAHIPETFTRLNTTITEINSITQKIAAGEGTIGLLVHNDSLYYELEKSSRDLNLLLEDIRLNPKKYVKFSIW